MDAKYIEIDPSSPVLAVQLYDSPAAQNPYMLMAGDVAKFDGRTPQVFVAPHANVPGLNVISEEGTTPLVRMLDDGDFKRGLATQRPAYYRFDEVRFQAGPGATIRPFRFAAPMWDAVALWVEPTVAPAGTTIALYGEHSDDNGNLIQTTIMAPVAIGAVGAKFWQVIGDAAVAAQNCPWVRAQIVVGLGAACDIRIAAELWRLSNT